MSKKLQEFGIQIPEVLLPAKGTDLEKWAVVACDQFTSEPEYWKNAEEITGDAPSTLHLTFPEIYLKDADKEQRIENINNKMKTYLSGGILQPQKPGFVIVDRKTAHSPSRKGLITAVDLEKYDYNKGSSSLIRATEGTVLDRIPPRVKIRENASIELPHIMILVDDPEKTLIEPLFKDLDSCELLYDFELMLDGGHIKGWRVNDPERVTSMGDALEKLADPAAFSSKYSVGSEKGVLLFAVGDGNHSLASAKAHWNNIKGGILNSALTVPEKNTLLANHPARYALAELVNVHDQGIMFEPIHRVLFGVNWTNVLEQFLSYFENGKVGGAGYKLFDSKQEMLAAAEELKAKAESHIIPFNAPGKFGLLMVAAPCFNLEVGTLQAFLDDLSKQDEKVEIDYIHGEQVVDKLGSEEDRMGFYLPAMNKHDLFKTVILEGVLPRKTFSMGEAEEKRYYLECRKICL